MTDETRKALESYCPEVKEIEYSFRFSNLREDWRGYLIAAAIRKAIIEGDEWNAFRTFFENLWDTERMTYQGEDIYEWLTNPETFNRMAAQAIEAGVIGITPVISS